MIIGHPMVQFRNKALPRLTAGLWDSYYLLPSPSRPCGNTCTVPQNENAVSLFYLGGDDGGLAGYGDP
jgi:hypothetical protein